jgi:hypothetical protein
MPTGDWEGYYHSITSLDLCCLRSHAVDNATALVAEYIALLKLGDDSYEKRLVL